MVSGPCDHISYWSRVVIVPLLVLTAMKPRARNSRGVRVDELFFEPPQTIAPDTEGCATHRVVVRFTPRSSTMSCAQLEPHSPRALRQRAIDRAVAFFTERLNGEDGLGAIFPAMANA